MKKLKNKVFFVIFSLLTIFTIIIFSGSVIRTYYEKKRAITDVITRMPNGPENPETKSKTRSCERQYIHGTRSKTAGTTKHSPAAHCDDTKNT